MALTSSTFLPHAVIAVNNSAQEYLLHRDKQRVCLGQGWSNKRLCRGVNKLKSNKLTKNQPTKWIKPTKLKKSHGKKTFYVSIRQTGQIQSWCSLCCNSVLSYLCPTHPEMENQRSNKGANSSMWGQISETPITPRPAQETSTLLLSFPAPTTLQNFSAQHHSCWIPSSLGHRGLLAATPAPMSKTQRFLAAQETF